jgi:gliding motility-associated-like protein
MLSSMFTTDTISETDLENPNVQQQNQVNETYNGWRKFKSYYQPQGGENTLSIGYFGALNYEHEIKDEPTHFLYYFIDSVRVEECDKDSTLAVILELPNVFTPNEDGINDFYEVKTNNLVSLDIIILNRWGNVIFEYDGLIQSWDGKTKNGNSCVDGIYFVKAIGETKQGERIEKHSFIHLFSDSK